MKCEYCGHEIKKKPEFNDAYQLALKEIGTKEIPGEEDNPRIIEYHAQTSLKASEDEVPWCSSFLCWCLEKAGIPSTRSARARSYEDWGAPILYPKQGDIAVLWRKSVFSTSGHVGFFERFEGEYVVLLGGNQKNKVGLGRYKKDRVISFRRWPNG